MKISLIVATGNRNEIGQNNGLLCRLPADLKHFKEITSGHTVIMGRRTFESLPTGPLPHRKNIVVSRQPDWKVEGVVVCPSLEAAWAACAGEEEVFVIGGAQIYRQALPMAGKLYLTHIHAAFPAADAFFPAIDSGEWREVRRETHPADDRHPYSFSFVELER
ncbi:MAG: dihydrofolate reductase [Dysgonamonadaceae bacterium]|jgi:dihydrofolate reductase|nr:dihydrofolate reductase [Dysgonamonadaceae bacterium]